MRDAVRTVHRHGDSEHAFIGSPDDEIRRSRHAVAVYDCRRGIDRLPGFGIAVFVCQHAVYLNDDRLGADRETHSPARRRRANLRELVDDKGNVRLVRVAQKHLARPVAADCQNVVVARVVVDLRRILVERGRSAARRMDDMCYTCNNLRDGVAVRGEDNRRIGVHGRPVGRKLSVGHGDSTPVLQVLVVGEDAVDRADRRPGIRAVY